MTEHTPLDFLGREIKEGDFIAYPTGGTSARMVLARVKRVEPLDYPVQNGLLGKSYVRLVVNRHKEGRRTSSDEGYWRIDDAREVRVDQLHRVIVVDGPA